MDRQVLDRGSLTASVDSTQDLTEDEIDTRNLMDGFVLRTAQIDLQRSRERTDYQYAKKIEEEATKQQFEGRRPAYDIGRRIAETIEQIDAEYGREVQSLADMTDTENIQGIIKEIVQELFSKGITIGRIAALLLYCYRLIIKLIASNAKVIIGVFAAIILYKVFIKIDFFKWIAKKGGMGILAAGEEAVDAVFLWRWWDYVRNGLGAGVGFITGRFINRANATPVTTSTTVTSTITQTTVQRVTHTVVRHTAQNRVALLFLIPIASIGFGYYWWKKRSR